jgi:hypothetical protein
LRYICSDQQLQQSSIAPVRSQFIESRWLKQAARQSIWLFQ